MDQQKRSNIVLLSLLGVPLGGIMLANAFPGEELRRNLYSDRGACERDYTPQQCQPSGGSGSSVTGWHGPYYYANRNAAGATSDPGPGRSGGPAAIETSTRGGFGSFGRAAGRAGS